MAYDAQDFEIEVTFMDNGGELVPRRYGVVTGTAYADLITALPDIITTIAATSDCLLYSYQVRSIWATDTPTVPASGIQNENQALLTFKIDGEPLKSATLSIPGAKPAIFVGVSGPNANVVNMTNAAVEAFAGEFVSGGLLTCSDGQNIVTEGGRGKRRHTKNSNG